MCVSRFMKTLDPKNQLADPANGRMMPANVPVSTKDQVSTTDQDGHARTQAILADLARRLENLERTQAAPAQPEMRSQSKDHISRMLSGKWVALFNLTGSTATLLPSLLGLIVTLARFLPVFPKLFFGLPGLLFPFGIITVASLAIVAAGHWIKRKSRRITFLAWTLGGYSLATAAYLLWLSAGFLHFNTLPSGVLLATCVYGTISILRKTLPDIKEMLALAETKAEEETSRSWAQRVPNKTL